MNLNITRNILDKLFIGLIYVIIFTFINSSKSFAATYYVDNVNGLDTDSGTTIELAWKTLSKATTVASAGDTVNVIDNGSLNPFRERLQPARSGTAESHIRFVGYNGSPVLLGSNDYSHSISNGWIWHASAVTGEYYLTKNNADPGISATLPRVLATSLQSDWNTSGVDSLINRSVGTIGSLSAGQWNWGNNDGLGYNTIYYRLASGEADITTVHIEGGVDGALRENPISIAWQYIDVENFKVRYSNHHGVNIKTLGNYAYFNNIDSSFTGRAGLSNTTFTNMTVLNSRFDHNGLLLPLNSDYSGIKLSGTTYATIRNNIFSNCVNDSGISVKSSSSNNTIENNIFYNNFQHGIDISISSNNNVVSNNTTYNNGGTGINIEGTSTGSIVKNNVSANNQLYQLSVLEAGSLTGLVLDNNAYYFSNPATTIIRYNGSFYPSTSFSTYQTNSGKDTNSLVALPQFLNTSGLFNQADDFKLTSSSPLINAGTNVGITQDFEGTVSPQGTFPDIGAFEFSVPNIGNNLIQNKADGSTVISSSAWIDENTVILRVTMSSTNPTDTLYPQFEIQESDIPFTNSPTQTGESVTYTGTGVLGEAIITGLESGKSYHWQTRVYNSAGQSAWVEKGGVPDFRVDTQAPSIPGTPTATLLLDSTKPEWTWTISEDSDSGLSDTPYSFQWCELSNFIGCDGNIGTSSTNIYTHSLGLNFGTWYFKVKATDILGNESEYSEIGSIVIAEPTPEPEPTDEEEPTTVITQNTNTPSIGENEEETQEEEVVDNDNNIDQPETPIQENPNSNESETNTSKDNYETKNITPWKVILYSVGGISTTAALWFFFKRFSIE